MLKFNAFEWRWASAHFLFVKPLADRESWLRTTLAGLGYELVDLESSRSGLLRVFIDSDKGINVDDCARVSHHLTRTFAVEGIDYERLEVSSPGLDRPLRQLDDYRRFAGRRAKIVVRGQVDGQGFFRGTLGGVEQREVLIDGEDGRTHRVPVDAITRANLEVEF